MVAILEAKDLMTLKLEQLIGSLITYGMITSTDNNKKKYNVALESQLQMMAGTMMTIKKSPFYHENSNDLSFVEKKVQSKVIQMILMVL